MHNKYMRKNVHAVCGTGIQTHHLQNTSLLLKFALTQLCSIAAYFARFQMTRISWALTFH